MARINPEMLTLESPLNDEVIREMVELIPALRDARVDDIARFDGEGYCYHGPLDRFFRLVYQSGLMEPIPHIDLNAWTIDQEEYFHNPSKVAVLDERRLRELLLFQVRQDRFSSGSLVKTWRTGLLVALLERVASLYCQSTQTSPLKPIHKSY